MDHPQEFTDEEIDEWLDCEEDNIDKFTEYTDEEIDQWLDCETEVTEKDVEQWLENDPDNQIIQEIEKWLEEKSTPQDPHHSSVTSPDKIVLEYLGLPHAEAYSSLGSCAEILRLIPYTKDIAARLGSCIAQIAANVTVDDDINDLQGIINVTVTAIHKSTSGSGCSRAELLIAFLKPFLLQARSDTQEADFLCVLVNIACDSLPSKPHPTTPSADSFWMDMLEGLLATPDLQNYQALALVERGLWHTALELSTKTCTLILDKCIGICRTKEASCETVQSAVSLICDLTEIAKVVLPGNDHSLFNPQITEAVTQLHDPLCNALLPFSKKVEDAHSALLFLGKTEQSVNPTADLETAGPMKDMPASQKDLGSDAADSSEKMSPPEVEGTTTTSTPTSMAQLRMLLDSLRAAPDLLDSLALAGDKSLRLLLQSVAEAAETVRVRALQTAQSLHSPHLELDKLQEELNAECPALDLNIDLASACKPWQVDLWGGAAGLDTFAKECREAALDLLLAALKCPSQHDIQQPKESPPAEAVFTLPQTTQLEITASGSQSREAITPAAAAAESTSQQPEEGPPTEAGYMTSETDQLEVPASGSPLPVLLSSKPQPVAGGPQPVPSKLHQPSLSLQVPRQEHEKTALVLSPTWQRLIFTALPSTRQSPKAKASKMHRLSCATLPSVKTTLDQKWEEGMAPEHRHQLLQISQDTAEGQRRKLEETEAFGVVARSLRKWQAEEQAAKARRTRGRERKKATSQKTAMTRLSNPQGSATERQRMHALDSQGVSRATRRGRQSPQKPMPASPKPTPKSPGRIGFNVSGMDRTKPFQSGSVIFRQPNIRRLQSLLCDLSIKYDRKLARNAEKAAHSLIKGMKTPQDLAVSCDLILQLDGCEPTEIQQRFRLCKEVMQHPVFAVSQAFVAGMQELFILLSKTWTFEGEKDLVGLLVDLVAAISKAAGQVGDKQAQDWFENSLLMPIVNEETNKEEIQHANLFLLQETAVEAGLKHALLV